MFHMDALSHATVPSDVNSFNMDELFETKRERDHRKLLAFQKILRHIHIHIRNISKKPNHVPCCLYVVPELTFGMKYNIADCIAYLVHMLTTNNFKVKYYHPNTLFISWNHWIPTYVCKIIKNKTGVVIDNLGAVKEPREPATPMLLESSLSMNPLGDSVALSAQDTPKKKNYVPVANYKPSGSTIYSPDLFTPPPFPPSLHRK